MPSGGWNRGLLGCITSAALALCRYLVLNRGLLNNVILSHLETKRRPYLHDQPYRSILIYGVEVSKIALHYMNTRHTDQSDSDGFYVLLPYI